MSRNPLAFISAMARLANQYLADADPPAWVEFLLHSHPAISKRVAMAQSFRGVDDLPWSLAFFPGIGYRPASNYMRSVG